MAVLCIVLATVFYGANWSGFNCNSLDIAPHFAGVIYAISNTVSTTPGIRGWICQLLDRIQTRQTIGHCAEPTELLSPA